VRLLLDTHVLLWWATGASLSKPATEAIAAPENEVFVSAASIWEAEIKSAAGRLEIGLDLAAKSVERGVTELPIRFEHAVGAARLPPHHSDPFDRMLAAQARLEGLTLVTRDPAFGPYGVDLIRA
jgi:PIN domain nuclease of toxin-antitoxin system